MRIALMTVICAGTLAAGPVAWAQDGKPGDVGDRSEHRSRGGHSGTHRSDGHSAKSARWYPSSIMRCRTDTADEVCGGLRSRPTALTRTSGRASS